MERLFLDCPNIYLRPLQSSDADGNYQHWFDRSDVCANNTRHRFPESKDSLLAYIQDTFNSTNALVLAIIQKDTHTHIGNIALQEINWIDRNADVSIVIGEKEYWGKGYAQQAYSALIKHAFQQLNMHRITMGTFQNHQGMQKVADKLGFVLEGTSRECVFKSGTYVDVLHYGLLRRDWKKANNY